MPINFPDAPTTGDTHTVGDKTWTYDGTAWTLVNGAIDTSNFLLNDSTTNFPTSLDTGLPDSIEALQAKVGVNGSAVATSLDYRTDQLESGNFTNASLTLDASRSVLGTVTGTQLTVIQDEYDITVDFYYIYLPTGTTAIWFLHRTTEAKARFLANLAVGRIINLGAFASTDGNPTYISVASWVDTGPSGRVEVESNPAASAPNYKGSAGFYADQYSYQGVAATILLPETSVETDNNSLAITQDRFFVGDFGPFTTSEVTVSGNTVTFIADIAGQVSVGDPVYERLPFVPLLTVYDGETGGFVSKGILDFKYTSGFIGQRVYTSSSTFAKADFPNGRFARVTCVGGGGASGNAPATGASQISVGTGGGAGGLVVAWFDFNDLDEIVTVTVGAGGSSAGASGGQSTFLNNGPPISFVAGSGGGGGWSEGPFAPPHAVRSASGGGMGIAGASWVEHASRGDSQISLALSSTIVVAAGGAGGGIRGQTGLSSSGGTTQRGTSGSMYQYYDYETKYFYGSYGGGGAAVCNTQNRPLGTFSSGNAGIIVVEVFV